MAFLSGVLVTVGVVAGVLAIVSSVIRWRFRRHPAAFVCRVRRPHGGDRRRWQLRRRRARWVHDVLLLQSGLLGVTLVPLAARVAPGAGLRPVPATLVHRLGRRPVALLLATEDDGTVELAVRGADRDLLVGLYLVAAMHSRSDAPREQVS